jgi:colicin import membrane protein
MGKNSLIKSTDKKKKSAKPVDNGTKKSVKKEAAKPAKSGPPEKAPEPKSAPVSTAPPPAAQKSLRDLIFEKFEPVVPQPVPQPMSSVEVSVPQAPPLITANDPAEADRIRKVLFARHSMDDIIAAAAKPVPPEAAAPGPGSAIPDSDMAQEAPKPPPPSPSEAATGPKTSHPVTEELKPVVTTVDSGDGPDPVNRIIKYAAAGFALLMILLIGASFKNSGNYYLDARDDALEIWRGRFSPTGKAFFLVLHDMQGPEVLKPVYTREEVFPIAFNYYLDKADAMLETSDMPDYAGMRSYLHQARKFAINPVTEAAVMTRLNSIERMPLLYKADVAISRGTGESLQAALAYLNQAQGLTTDSAQAELVAQKTATVEAALSALAATESQAAAEAAAEAEGEAETEAEASAETEPQAQQ